MRWTKIPIGEDSRQEVHVCSSNDGLMLVALVHIDASHGFEKRALLKCCQV